MDRRSLRSRKVSERIAGFDEADQRQAVRARLDALEDDNVKEDALAPGSDDEEFVLEGDSDAAETQKEQGPDKKRRRKSGSMRKTRGMVAERERGARTFRDWLQEADLEQAPAPNYLTAVVGPPRVASQRHYCSVCGDVGRYSCARCGSRFCSRRCNTTHTETRCLKFTL